MATKSILWTAILLVGLGLFFWFRPNRNYTNYPPLQGTAWVAFGDSLTAGYGASEGNDYPALLSKRLRISIANISAPGLTTQDAVARVPEVLRLDPRVVLLCFGGNDTLNSVPHEQTFQNLAQVIAELQQAGAFVVLIGIRSASLRDKYAAEFQRLARTTKVLLVPNVLGGVLGDPSLMSDYVHPNDQGYAVIAERLDKVLQPLLPQLIR